MTWLRPRGSVARDGDPVRIDPPDAGWTWCGLQVLELGADESRSLVLDGREALVVPLSGGCVVTTDHAGFELGGRSSVFEALTDSCYLPPGTRMTLTSAAGGEFAVATSAATAVGSARYLPAAGVSVEVRGAGQMTRQVNGLLSADVAGPEKLIVVEVLTPAGNWSSYPPHKHDEWSASEVPLEEIYYFRVRGEGGFALHRTYTADGAVDETVTVRDGDVYLIPRGYHGPCVAAPGYDLYYLNVMAGPDPHRRWLVCNDPAHDWVARAWPAMTPDPRLPMTHA